MLISWFALSKPGLMTANSPMSAVIKASRTNINHARARGLNCFHDATSTMSGNNPKNATGQLYWLNNALVCSLICSKKSLPNKLAMWIFSYCPRVM